MKKHAYEQDLIPFKNLCSGEFFIDRNGFGDRFLKLDTSLINPRANAARIDTGECFIFNPETLVKHIIYGD